MLTSCSTLFIMSIISKEGVGNMGWPISHSGVFVNTSTLLSFEVLIELPLSLSLLLSPSLCLPPSFSGVCWNGSRSAESAPCATNPFAACGQTPHKPPSSRRVSWRSEIGIPAVFDTPRSSGTFSFTVQQKGVLVKHIYIYLWCIISALHSVLWFKKANYQVWDHQLIHKCLKTAAAEEHF